MLLNAGESELGEDSGSVLLIKLVQSAGVKGFYQQVRCVPDKFSSDMHREWTPEVNQRLWVTRMRNEWWDNEVEVCSDPDTHTRSFQTIWLVPPDWLISSRKQQTFIVC